MQILWLIYLPNSIYQTGFSCHDVKKRTEGNIFCLVTAEVLGTASRLYGNFITNLYVLMLVYHISFKFWYHACPFIWIQTGCIKSGG